MSLRILSYNIKEGGQGRLPLLEQIIRQQQSDVVALLEARNRSFVEALAEQFGMYFVIGEANNVNQDHVVWLSHHPVLRAENHCLPVFAKTLLEIEVLWEEKPVALFATHLKAGQDWEREAYRVREMQAIIQMLAAHQNQCQVLVGDFNTAAPGDQPDVLAYEALLKARGEHIQLQFPHQVIPLLLSAGYGDCYPTRHPLKSGYTTPTTSPALRCDYIFASSSCMQHLCGCDLVTGEEAEKASDHFAIWAQFRAK